MKNNYDFPVELQPIYLADGKEIPNKRAVVRTDTEDTLGIVSPEYGLVKHTTVIDSFREAGKKYAIEEKVSLTRNGANLFYQMKFPKVQTEIKKDDIVRMSMIVKNSYNGMNSVQIIFGAFRLVCENGMILGAKFMHFNFRHIGNVGGLNSVDMVEQYKEAYQGHIKLFNEKMPMITEMARQPIHASNELFDHKTINLPQYLLDEAKTSFRDEKDKTVWGYYNSLTYAISHKLKTDNPERAIFYGMEAWKAAEFEVKGRN